MHCRWLALVGPSVKLPRIDNQEPSTHDPEKNYQYQRFYSTFNSRIQRPRDLCVVLPDVLVIRLLEIPIICLIFQMGMFDRGIGCLIERKSRKSSD